MKILILTSSPLQKTHIVDLYIKEISCFFDTEIWDVSRLFSNNKRKTDFPEVLVVKSLAEFEERLDEILQRDKIIVITNILIFDLHVIYKQLHRRRVPIVSIDKEMMIFWMNDNYVRQYPEKVSKKERDRCLIKSMPLLRQVYSYLEYQHARFDYMLGAYNYYPDASRHFYHIHNLKYDEYLHTGEKEAVIQGRYILFLDGALAHHPSHEGKMNAIDKKEYLRNINAFFDKVEKQYALPVIIASHPKAGYDKNDFMGRPVIVYKTPELIKHAEWVLAHYSTSLIELVLQKKKVVFLYSKAYMNSDSKKEMESVVEYAHMLRAPLVDIEEDEKIELCYDEEAYESFTRKYIVCKGKENFSNAELIIDFLKKIAGRN